MKDFLNSCNKASVCVSYCYGAICIHTVPNQKKENGTFTHLNDFQEKLRQLITCKFGKVKIRVSTNENCKLLLISLITYTTITGTLSLSSGQAL